MGLNCFSGLCFNSIVETNDTSVQFDFPYKFHFAEIRTTTSGSLGTVIS
jgi:hypothetical protein